MTRLSPTELAAIKARLDGLSGPLSGLLEVVRLVDEDVPRLVNEVEQLQAELQERRQAETAATIEDLPSTADLNGRDYRGETR
jgi:hypothetical protein